jgi:serine/threonine protein kinase
MPTILNIGIQIINILQAVHKQGIIYRDVKPENFLIGNADKTSNKIYICDFGLAKYYLRPSEQAKNGAEQAKAKIFSPEQRSPRA